VTPFAQCVRCGACTAVCPVYRLTGQEGHSARGRMLVLASFADTPSSLAPTEVLGRCLMCGSCEAVCSRQLPLLATFAAARGRLPPGAGTRPRRRQYIRRLLASPRLLRLLSRLGISLTRLALLPADSGLWRKLGLPPPQFSTSAPSLPTGLVMGDEGQAQLFAGCLARHLQPEIVSASLQLAARGGLTAADPAGQGCCGLAAWSAGDLAGARSLARRNIALYREQPGPILTPCASCQVQLLRYAELLADDPAWAAEAARFSARVQGLFDLPPSPACGRGTGERGDRPVYFHLSCHLRHRPELASGPRRALKQIPELHLVKPAGPDLCCGQGGLFQQAYPDLAGAIFAPLYRQVAATGAELVVTSCSGCLLQWQSELASCRGTMRAVHLAVFLARYLGEKQENSCSRRIDLLKLNA